MPGLEARPSVAGEEFTAVVPETTLIPLSGLEESLVFGRRPPQPAVSGETSMLAPLTRPLIGLASEDSAWWQTSMLTPLTRPLASAAVAVCPALTLKDVEAELAKHETPIAKLECLLSYIMPGVSEFDEGPQLQYGSNVEKQIAAKFVRIATESMANPAERNEVMLLTAALLSKVDKLYNWLPLIMGFIDAQVRACSAPDLAKNLTLSLQQLALSKSNPELGCYQYDMVRMMLDLQKRFPAVGSQILQLLQLCLEQLPLLGLRQQELIADFFVSVLRTHPDETVRQEIINTVIDVAAPFFLPGTPTKELCRADSVLIPLLLAAGRSDQSAAHTNSQYYLFRALVTILQPPSPYRVTPEEALNNYRRAIDASLRDAVTTGGDIGGLQRMAEAVGECLLALAEGKPMPEKVPPLVLLIQNCCGWLKTPGITVPAEIGLWLSCHNPMREEAVSKLWAFTRYGDASAAAGVIDWLLGAEGCLALLKDRDPKARQDVVVNLWSLVYFRDAVVARKAADWLLSAEGGLALLQDRDLVVRGKAVGALWALTRSRDAVVARKAADWLLSAEGGLALLQDSDLVVRKSVLFALLEITRSGDASVAPSVFDLTRW